MKNKLKPKQLSRFRQYVNNEVAILKVVQSNINDDKYEKTNRNFRKSDDFIFAENPGEIQLFSIIEAHNLYINAISTFGSENAKYAQLKLTNATKLGNRRRLTKAPSSESLTALRDQFPNFNKVIEVCEGAFALSALTSKSYLHIPPLLLLGPPGVGKTAFVQMLSKLIDTHFERIDIGISSSSAILAGISLTWGSGRCGEIFNLMMESEFINPIVMLDEVDKALGNHVAPIEPILLSLLEPESAKSFKDEAINLSIDTSKIIWIATANNKERISEALLSRFTVIEILPPTYEQAKKIIGYIYKNFKDSNPWGESFESKLDEQVVNILAQNSPRSVLRLLRNAFGKAAFCKRNKILIDDIEDTENMNLRKMGFV